MSHLCQATQTEPATEIIKSHSPDGPYRLCAAAAQRLTDYALRPIEWYRLAIIHGPMEFLLHDDFYNEQGEAGQPRVDVVDAHLYPVPTLTEVADDLPALFDFLLTRWHIEPEHNEALKLHGANAVLAEAMSRYPRTSNWEHHHHVYLHAAAEAAGLAAHDWILSLLPSLNTERQLAVLHAGLHGVQPALAFDMITRLWLSLPHSQRKYPSYDLARLGDPQAIPWIEKHVADPLVNAWGDIAAACGLDWATTVRWVLSARPLSLVALDALVARIHPSATHLWKFGRRPRFDGPDLAEASALLNAYRESDPVPRVSTSVELIVSHWDEVLK